MIILDQLPLSLAALILASLVVCAGSTLQVATGAGLGLLAGPVLLLSLNSGTAVFVSIVLNLLVSLALLPQERRQIAWAPLRLLMAGTVVGLPLGWLALNLIDVAFLRLITGVIVLAAALQLIILARQIRDGDPGLAVPRTLLGGGFSGIMSGGLAIPGPVALWTLLRQNLAATPTRATLRALYVFSYTGALMIHLGLGGGQATSWRMIAALLPALGVGIGLGILAKRRVGDAILHGVLRMLLLVMGGSLLVKGVLDVAV